jgi:phospholipase/carboxylesterase
VSGLDALAHEIRPASGEPQGALVLMHGRGTTEQDLLPLLDVLDPRRKLVGVAPGGPLSLPPGGKHWYAVRALGYPEPETFHATYDLVAGFVDALPEAIGVPWGRTILGGFSQGTVMSYALGLGRGRPSPAGILAMSGFIPTVEGFELDLDDRAGYPVFIAHGENDPIIGVEWGRQAAQRLGEAGADVTYRESPVTHVVDPRELPLIAEWVSRTLAPPGAPGA